MTSALENSRVDRSSLSNYQSVVSQDLHLQWTLDFAKEIIFGSATHTIKVLESGTATVDFDTSNLHIEGATIDGDDATYYYDGETGPLGRKLCVEIPGPLQVEGRIFDITFRYATDPAASAIQWLDAKGTTGGEQPFVFTQSQAIHARSLFPCMDSPAVKVPYSAEIRAPAWCTVLMSALQVSDAVEEEGAKVFKWKQPVRTPAYLVALAAGRLESREISPRVRVWAEPEVIKAAAYEFAETEEFLSTAESLTCPYAWTRYDVLCLPPSFPYGGMENPCLTFATPTLLAGDRSLADVIAHEIAHSWTGNLVTNATWEHFWLNEGWTVWLERKITSKFKGGVEHSLLSAEIGWKALEDSVKMLGGDEGRYTALVWPLSGEDPDDAFSSVPYEKGFNLLYYLEGIVGTTAFESFAKAYISKYQFSTVTSADFKNYFCTYFCDNAAINSLDWHSLYHSKGMPKQTPDFSNALSKGSKDLAARWTNPDTACPDSGSGPAGVSKADIAAWSSQQTCVFLETLLQYNAKNTPLSGDMVEKMDLAYGFTASNNAEIKFRWQTLCLQCECTWIIPHVMEFLGSQGRMKFVRPLHRSLKNAKIGQNGKLARDSFAANSAKYHPIARKMIAQDLSAVVKYASSKSKSPSSVNPPADNQRSSLMAVAGVVAVAAAVAFAVLRKK
jgi:leukotriene-A4 hydrolase